MARISFKCDVERTSPEELKTAYWDYDSETGKRYSEEESGEESNNDDTIETKKKLNQPTGYASSGGSSSTSSSEHSSEGSKKKKRVKKRSSSQKKSSSSVPLSKYNKDQEEHSDHIYGKFSDVNQDLKRMSSECNMLRKKDKLNDEAILELNTKMNLSLIHI